MVGRNAFASRIVHEIVISVIALALTLVSVRGLANESETSLHPLTIKDLMAVRLVSRVDMSPDGHWILIVATGTNLDANIPSLEVYLKDVQGGGQLRTLPLIAAQAVWNRDSKGLTALVPNGDCTQLWRVPVATREAIRERETCLEPKGQTISSYSWSVDGRFLAYVVQPSRSSALASFVQQSTSLPKQSDSGSCIDIDSPEARSLGMDALDRACSGTSVGTGWMWGLDVASPSLRGYSDSWEHTGPAELWTFDVASGSSQRVSGQSDDVRSYAWSQRNHDVVWLSVVASEVQDPHYGGPRTFTAGSATLNWRNVSGNGSTVRRIAIGDLSSPDLFLFGLRWSPDGLWFAVGTSTGVTLYSAAEAQGRPKSRRIFTGRPMQIDWSSDSRTLYVLRSAMPFQTLISIDLRSGSAKQATDDSRWHGKPSFTQDHRAFALTLEDVGEPTRIYTGHAGSTRLKEVVGFNDLNPQWTSVVPFVRGRVDWRSPDDRYDLFGVTITTNEGARKAVRPMIVVLLGAGMPTMNRFSMMETQQPILLLAAAGYTVFVPNSRGRDGINAEGYQGLGAERTYFSKPWLDVDRGIDTAVAERIADGDRIGLMGDSYGAALAGYGITHSQRFKVAIFKEPVALDQGAAWRMIWGREHFGGDVMGKEFGIDNPYSGDGKKFIDEESPITNVTAVRTPTMLEFGAKSGAAQMGGNEFYHALVWLKVPTDLRIYPRTGHGFIEPKLIADSSKSELDWISRWLPR